VSAPRCGTMSVRALSVKVGNRIENLRKGDSISVDNLLDVAVAEKAILKLHSMRDGSPVTVRGWSLGST
jgi:hypothetical protein